MPISNSMVNGVGNLQLGINYGNANTETSDCQVSDVRIYATWLTDAEINTINREIMGTYTYTRIPSHVCFYVHM